MAEPVVVTSWVCSKLRKNKDKENQTSSALLTKHSCRPPPNTQATSNKLHQVVPHPCGGSGSKQTQGQTRQTRNKNSAIVDSGASGLYLTKHAPKVKVREDTPLFK